MASRSTNRTASLADSGNIWQRLYSCLLVRNTGPCRLRREATSPQTPIPLCGPRWARATGTQPLRRRPGCRGPCASCDWLHHTHLTRACVCRGAVPCTHRADQLVLPTNSGLLTSRLTRQSRGHALITPMWTTHACPTATGPGGQEGHASHQSPGHRSPRPHRGPACPAAHAPDASAAPTPPQQGGAGARTPVGRPVPGADPSMPGWAESRSPPRLTLTPPRPPTAQTGKVVQRRPCRHLYSHNQLVNHKELRWVSGGQFPNVLQEEAKQFLGDRRGAAGADSERTLGR